MWRGCCGKIFFSARTPGGTQVLDPVFPDFCTFCTPDVAGCCGKTRKFSPVCTFFRYVAGVVAAKQNLHKFAKVQGRDNLERAQNVQTFCTMWRACCGKKVTVQVLRKFDFPV